MLFNPRPYVAADDPGAAENKRRQSMMSARAYWNLPGADDDARFQVDYGGIWNPDLTPTETIRSERAKQRLEMQNLADGGNRRQAERVGGLDQLVEGFSEAGQGGRSTAVRFTGAANPYSPVGQSSIRNDPGSSFNTSNSSLPTLDTPGARVATMQRQSSKFGGSTVPQFRPSMTALYEGGYDPSRSPEGNAYFARQQRAADIESEADARRRAGNADLENASINALFDLGSGRASARAQGAGDITRSESRQNARAGAETYFDPEVSRQRQAEQENALDQYRARYSDPALARAQATIEAANIRSQGGIDRESMKGLYGYLDQILKNQQSGQNNVNDNRARIGAGVVAGRPNADVSPYMPQGGGPAADPSRSLTMQEFQDYMRSTGKSPEEAFADLQQGGYQLAR